MPDQKQIIWLAIYKHGLRFDKQIQLAVWAGLKIGASELQVQRSYHLATVTITETA